MTSCRVCAEPFIPFQPLQAVCSLKCAKRVPIIARNTLKAEKKADRAKRESLKPRSKWLAEAQKEVNAYVRIRDAALPCISCGKYHEGKYDAGHYLSTGARPELRFDESNIHRQCVPCNRHLHGNLVLYRAALVERIGLSGVLWLEGPHEPKKYTIEDLKAIKAEYQQKARDCRLES